MLLICTGISSQSLASKGIDAPTFQAFLNYVLLAATFGAARATHWRTPLQQQWWRYALLAVLDVEGNYLVTRAYQCVLRQHMSMHLPCAVCCVGWCSVYDVVTTSARHSICTHTCHCVCHALQVHKHHQCDTARLLYNPCCHAAEHAVAEEQVGML